MDSYPKLNFWRYPQGPLKIEPDSLIALLLEISKRPAPEINILLKYIAARIDEALEPNTPYADIVIPIGPQSAPVGACDDLQKEKTVQVMSQFILDTMEALEQPNSSITLGDCLTCSQVLHPQSYRIILPETYSLTPHNINAVCSPCYEETYTQVCIFCNSYCSETHCIILYGNPLQICKPCIREQASQYRESLLKNGFQ